MKEKSHLDVTKARAMAQHVSLYASPTFQTAPEYGKSASANQPTNPVKDKDETPEVESKTPAKSTEGNTQDVKGQTADAATLSNVNNAIYVAHLNGTATAKPPAQPVNAPKSTGTEEIEQEEKHGATEGGEISQGGDGPNATNTHKASADGAEEGSLSLEDIGKIVEYVLAKVEEIRAIIANVVVQEASGGNIGEPAKAEGPDSAIPIANVPATETLEFQGGASLGVLKNTNVKPPPLSQFKVKELDGVVDPYMSANWQREKYDELCIKYGVTPNAIGSVMDKILPPDMPASMKMAANFMYASATGLLDAAWMGVLSGTPGVGIIAGPAFALRDWYNAHSKVPRLENSWADEAILVMEGIRGILDMSNGVVGGIEGVLTLLEYIGAIGAGTLGAVVGTAGTPAGTAAGGATGGGAGITVGGIVQLAVLAVSTKIQEGVILSDAAITLLSLWAAEDARQEGEFGKAEAFGALAQEHVFRTVGDIASLVINAAVEICTIGLAPSTIFKEVAGEVTEKSLKEIFKEIPQNSMTTIMQKATENRADLALLFGPDAGEWWEDWYKVTGTDVMKRKNPLINPGGVEGKGDAAGILQPARQGTLDEFDTSWESLKAEDPDWHQKLLNDILAPEDPTFWQWVSKMMLPSGWIELAMLQGEAGCLALFDLMISMEQSKAEALATTLEGPVQGALNWMIDTIAANVDIEDDLAIINEMLEEQRMGLGILRSGVEQLEASLPVIQDAIDFGPELSLTLNELISSTETLKLTPDDLNLPSIVPDSIINQILNPYNEVVDSLITQLREQAQSLSDAISTQVQQIADIFNEKLERFKLMIAEGSEAEKMFIAAQDMLAKKVADWLHIVAEFTRGNIQVDFSGVANLIRSINARAEEAKHSARWEEFVNHLQTEGQSYVDGWKERHGEEVHLLFYPAMPGEEISAMESAYKLLKNRVANATIDENFTQEQLDTTSQQIEQHYSTAKGQIGKKGKDEVEIFWTELNALASISIPGQESKEPEPEKETPEPEKPEKEKPVKRPTRIHTVVKHNNLWNLAKRYYGDPRKYHIIHKANATKVKDPHWIFPGQELVIPYLDELDDKSTIQ
ncbi:LysM peptidoglycan-binding domain-containing protein [Saprospiraceae bacterium]|nr:LysM peptidoglycan-binding domain-containing protein [Saprospiraceae bacterium]